MVKKILMPLSLALVFSMETFAAEKPIGIVIASRGQVKVEGIQARTLSRGKPIFLKEIIATKDKSRIQIRLNDGTIVTLEPNTRYQMETFILDSKNNKNNSYVGKLIEGTLVNLSGNGTKDNHIIKTNVVTIAARGTYFEIKSRSKKLKDYLPKDRKKQQKAPTICKDLLMETGETFVMDGELEISSKGNKLCHIAANDPNNNNCTWEAIGCFNDKGEFLFTPSPINTPEPDRRDGMEREIPETELSPQPELNAQTEQDIYYEEQVGERG
jgi:hypothetical protein